jgi:hypothetical protein
VEVRWVNYSIPPPWTTEFITGYNTASEWLLTQKYGRDIFTECANQAVQEGKSRPWGRW